MRNGLGTTGGTVRVQGSLRAGLTLLLAWPALAGCSSLDSVNPVNWWHSLEGGPIADQRPPPPNADAPYRNLGDAPTSVPPADAAKRGLIANALVADRANAQYAATLEPLSAPPVAVKPSAPKPAAAASADASSASLEAASAPPAPAGPVARAAPAAPVQSAPLPPPAETAPSAPTTAPTADASPPPAAELPPVPQTPPLPPALAGVPATTAPTPPPPTPKPAPPPVAALKIGAPVSVAFPSGSAALPSAALPGLKLLARSYAPGNIAITGYGEAKGSSPEAQQAAMPLAMSRVRAIAAYLLESGVPSAALRIDGEAQGTGAVARVLK